MIDRHRHFLGANLNGLILVEMMEMKEMQKMVETETAVKEMEMAVKEMAV